MDYEGNTTLPLEINLDQCDFYFILSVIVTMLFFMSLEHYINVINNASFRGLYYDLEFLEYNSAQFLHLGTIWFWMCGGRDGVEPSCSCSVISVDGTKPDEVKEQTARPVMTSAVFSSVAW